jgi:nucleoside-diphosphate-sugar epimerase
MRILVAGAGGFIGGHLVGKLVQQGHEITAADIKQKVEWHQVHNSVVNWSRSDCADFQNNLFLCHNQDLVINLAANMGGMGFIETHRVDCLRSVLINTNLIEAAYRAGVKKYFYASSACVYNTELQANSNVTALKESDAYPAMAERGYGWEKLFSEMLCQEYHVERGMQTFIARFHNVYGPYGTYKGGREKAPAAICRKVIEAKKNRSNEIEIWGDGNQTRSFMHIDDCITGIEKIMSTSALAGVPINLGSNELVSINELVEKVERIAGTFAPLTRRYDLNAPKGVTGRNSDNTMIKQYLGWEPQISLSEGLEKTYKWIEQEMK